MKNCNPAPQKPRSAILKILHIFLTLLALTLIGCATHRPEPPAPAEADPAVSVPDPEPEPPEPDIKTAPTPVPPARPQRPRQIETKTPASTGIRQLEQRLAQARINAGQNPRDPLSYYRLGNALFDLGSYDQAKAAYEKAIDLDPQNAPAHINRGLCLRRLGKAEDAIQEYNLALAIQPDDATLLQNLAIALEGEGKTSQAVEVLARLVEVHPADVSVLARLAQGLFRLGRYREAGYYFQEIIRLDPGLASDYYNLGLCYFHLGDYDRTLITWLTALAHDINNESVNKGLAVLYWKRAEYKQAWDMVAACHARGITIDDKFLAKLRKDSQAATTSAAN